MDGGTWRLAPATSHLLSLAPGVAGQDSIFSLEACWPSWRRITTIAFTGLWFSSTLSVPVTAGKSSVSYIAVLMASPSSDAARLMASTTNFAVS